MLLFGILLAIVIGVSVAVVGSFGAFDPAAITARATSSATGFGVLALIVVGYLGAFIVFGTIYRRFLQFGIWQKVVDNMEVHGVEALDDVRVQGAPSGATAEALADALDFGF